MRALVGSTILILALSSCLQAKDKQSAEGFPRGQLKISGKTLEIEIADTDPLRAKGLMFRKSLGKNQGMLFIFPDEQRRTFWMKNTFIPLSIGYFDKNKRLIEVLDMEPVKSEMQVSIPQYPSSRPATFALEVNRGWFYENKVKPGDTFTFTKH